MAAALAGTTLTLAGPGRAGKAFARSWLEAGGSIGDVISRTAGGASDGVRAIGSGSPRVLGDSAGDCDVLVVAVPDDAVPQAASALAGRFRCRTAFHVSGALPAAAIEPLRAFGASLGSFHAARVFTGSPGETWRGAFVAIEGDDRAVSEGERIAAAFETVPCRISAEAKALYHAAATLAAGGTTALVSLATRAWVEAGIPGDAARRALAALAGGAAEAARRHGFEGAFTGPVARRDLSTVAAHASALAARPGLLEIYRLLARETLRATPGRGREAEIEALLEAAAGPRGPA